MPKRIAEKNAARQQRYSVKQKATENEEKKIYVFRANETMLLVAYSAILTLRRTAYARFDVAQQCSAPVAQQIQQIYMLNENLGAKSENRRKNDAFTNGLSSVWQAKLGGRFASARRQHSRRSLLPCKHVYRCVFVSVPQNNFNNSFIHFKHLKGSSNAATRSQHEYESSSAPNQDKEILVFRV